MYQVENISRLVLDVETELYDAVVVVLFFELTVYIQNVVFAYIIKFAIVCLLGIALVDYVP